MAEPGSVAEIQSRNRAGDLEYIPVPREDTSTWLERVYGMVRQGIYGEAQPGQRGTWVPSQINAQGKPELAVPGVVQQPAESLQALMTAPLGDIVRSGDRDAIRSAAEASFDVAGALPAAGAAIGRTVPNNAAGIFGGRLAKTADQAALKRAEDMAAKGTPREQIWNETGWFKAPDGKWKFEIDDSGSYATGNEGARTLGQALHHPDLYAAYPDMQGLKFVNSFDDASYVSGGLFKSPKVTAHASDSPTLLHEGQHRVQDVEGFAQGSSPAAEWLQSMYGTGPLARARLMLDLARNGGNIEVRGKAAENAMDAYRKTAGETESRTVERRMGLSAEDRKARPPWLDYSVPESQQTVKFSANPDDPNTAAALSALTAQDKPQGIKAYHGSPHDFDKFDLSKIGTGEGAQVYGHGLYFAENEEVAIRYRENLGRRYNLDRRPAFDKAAVAWPDDLARVRKERQDALKKSVADAFANTKERNKNNPDSNSWDWSEYEAAKSKEEAAIYDPRSLMTEEELARIDREGAKLGHMYEVNINASPDDFLDWDRPLSQQQRLVDLFGIDEKGRLQLPNGERVPPEQLRGESFYRAIAEANAGGRGPASDVLREAGIPGIRYLDQGSRTAGEGSRNYVVFDDALVNILRKYSNAPDPNTAAILAILAAQQGGQQQ